MLTSEARCSRPSSSSGPWLPWRHSSSLRTCPSCRSVAGLGVAYIAGGAGTGHRRLGRRRPRRLPRRRASRQSISAEPGRAIAAAAAVTLYTVGTIKEIPGVRTYLSVDGGMSDNPRPVLYGSGYEAFLVRFRPAPSGSRPFALSANTVSRATSSSTMPGCPPATGVGDVLCTPVTGAYGHSMGSNYNMVRRPAVVFVKDGEGTRSGQARDLR